MAFAGEPPSTDALFPLDPALADEGDIPLNTDAAMARIEATFEMLEARYFRDGFEVVPGWDSQSEYRRAFFQFSLTAPAFDLRLDTFVPFGNHDLPIWTLSAFTFSLVEVNLALPHFHTHLHSHLDCLSTKHDVDILLSSSLTITHFDHKVYALNLNIQQLVEAHLQANRTFDATKTALQQSDAAHILTKRNPHLTDLTLVQSDRDFQQISSALAQSKREQIEQLYNQIVMRRKDIKTARTTSEFLHAGQRDTVNLMYGPDGLDEAATAELTSISDSIEDNFTAGIRLATESIRRWEWGIEQCITKMIALESQLAN
ncbi:hypothetical protein D6D01_04308 [Aureobasidium pullulans]|uniref:Uncharacterized protein n=1 Tax=Aureobasidium pullulans TaxID=5580 RepID=A0A4S9LBY1_AURPU|nr:hypothetical protein D6D01_04308 [Aureobasidium pullulans]